MKWLFVQVAGATLAAALIGLGACLTFLSDGELIQNSATVRLFSYHETKFLHIERAVAIFVGGFKIIMQRIEEFID